MYSLHNNLDAKCAGKLKEDDWREYSPMGAYFRDVLDWVATSTNMQLQAKQQQHQSGSNLHSVLQLPITWMYLVEQVKQLGGNVDYLITANDAECNLPIELNRPAVLLSDLGLTQNSLKASLADTTALLANLNAKCVPVPLFKMI